MNTPQKYYGAAFPHKAKHWDSDSGCYVDSSDHYERGMTLRDWFAGQALHTAWAGLARSEDERMGEQVGTYQLNPGDDVFTCAKYTAIRAYEIADAMLAERNRL